MDLPRAVHEYYEDVFPDELPELPPQRDVDFCIELHPGTSPISMTPHRMTPVELQELKVQILELLDKGFKTEHFTMGRSGSICEEERQDPSTMQ